MAAWIPAFAGMTMTGCCHRCHCDPRESEGKQSSCLVVRPSAGLLRRFASRNDAANFRFGTMAEPVIAADPPDPTPTRRAACDPSPGIQVTTTVGAIFCSAQSSSGRLSARRAGRQTRLGRQAPATQPRGSRRMTGKISSPARWRVIQSRSKDRSVPLAAPALSWATFMQVARRQLPRIYIKSEGTVSGRNGELSWSAAAFVFLATSART
jgi:hypothetical protein